MVTKLPIPNSPKRAEDVTRWAGDTTRVLEMLFRTLPEQVELPVVPYSETSALKGIIACPIIVPDHPSGYSIIIWDGTVFQRFTAAGVL